MKTKLELYNAIKEYAVNIGYTSVEEKHYNSYCLEYENRPIACFSMVSDNFKLRMFTNIDKYSLLMEKRIHLYYSGCFNILKEYKKIIYELTEFTVAYKKAQKELLIREIEN